VPIRSCYFLLLEVEVEGYGFGGIVSNKSKIHTFIKLPNSEDVEVRRLGREKGDKNISSSMFKYCNLKENVKYI
jgi:hypothetical protein